MPNAWEAAICYIFPGFLAKKSSFFELDDGIEYAFGAARN
jgi:hypothetical protein